MVSSVYTFDEIVERRGSGSLKWDACKEVFGREDLLPMWVADADWPAPPEVQKAFQRLTDHGVFGYTAPTEEHRRIVVDWVERQYHWTIEEEWILFTPGVVPSLNVAVRAFTNPGDEVVIQSPVYYPFFSAITQQGAHVVNNQLQLQEGTYTMVFEDLEEKITKKRSLPSSASRIKMLILCSPHNPVGRVWEEEELLHLRDICKKQGILVVSDEIHSDLILGDKEHIIYSKISPEDSITMISPSKTFNIPGLQIAVMIIPNARIRRTFKDATAGILKSGNTFALEALKVTYSQCDRWLEEELTYLQENLAYIERWIEKIPGIKAIRPEGTYLLWLDCTGLSQDSERINQFFLHKAKVALDDGRWFGDGGEGFMRLNFACPRSLLEEGLSRIEEAIHEEFIVNLK